MKNEIVYLTEYFPGSSGYRGGGAEMVLERLATTLGNQYGDAYEPKVFIASDWQPVAGKEYSFQAIVREDIAVLIEELVQRQRSDSILHMGNTFLATRFPMLFRRLVNDWSGPVILRVPNVSKIEEVLRCQEEDFFDFLSGVDVLISQSEMMTHELQALGLASERIVQIENGIDCERKKPLAEEKKLRLRMEKLPGIADASTVFLYAGRMYDAGKKIEDLLQAWLEGAFHEKNAHLVLAGEYKTSDGLIQPHLASFFKHFSLEEMKEKNIHLLGLLSEEEMEVYYRIADVYVSPSADEGFSNAMLEASAFGLPLIGREGVHGNEHLIHPNETGLFFRDLKGLSESMERLAADRVLRTALGFGARTLTERNHTIETMLKKYIALYGSLLMKSREEPLEKSL